MAGNLSIGVFVLGVILLNKSGGVPHDNFAGVNKASFQRAPFSFQGKTWSCVRRVILPFTRFPPLSPLAFRVVLVLRIGRLWRDVKADRVAGPRGADQLLLRSQGPRGPIAIACPVTTPNQSLRVRAFRVFSPRSLVKRAVSSESALRATATNPRIAAAASYLGSQGDSGQQLPLAPFGLWISAGRWASSIANSRRL